MNAAAAASRPGTSLRRRLLAAILLPLGLIFVLSVVLDYRLARETADGAFDQSLADAVFDLAAHLSPGVPDVAVEMTSEGEAMLRSSPDGRVFFSVRDAAGRLLAGDAELPALPAGEAGRPRFHDGQFSGETVRYAVLRTDAGHGATVTISVAETLGKRQRASRRILAAMMVPSAVLLLATLVAVYVGVQRGLAPLDDIEAEIGRRSARELHEIELPAVPQEVRPMLTRLNDLLALLREAAAAQQRFLAGAAHQLRTPLAGLQTQVELAAHEGRFDGSPERLARIDEAIGRMGHLVQQLLTYAQAEPAAALTRRHEPVDLKALVEQAASLFLDQALAKRIDIGFEPGAATVSGVPWLLREALSNLIDNALRYTPAGGVVTVGSGQTAGRPWLRVVDNGPGIPAAERERVFERFYRVAGTHGDGVGLGLAIVREIAALHQAEIRLDDAPEGGLMVSLIFPAAGA
ncbi:sensor histidine kinase N-terminal domain-containing protein [Ideonella sp. DXS29W]|uniref:histidine kinase n=1 Tax=Ideonella lacteola TaxID=2984193 RepID=A0ABU9BNX0_9BURK